MSDKYNITIDEGTVIRIPDIETDYVAMVSRGQLIGLWQSDLFIDTIRERFGKVLCVADEVISSLKKNLDYNGYYIAFLLDQLSEDEFQNISEDHSISLQKNVKDDEIREKVSILFGISKENFTPSDLSNIFKIEESVAENIVNKLKEQGVIEKTGNY